MKIGGSILKENLESLFPSPSLSLSVSHTHIHTHTNTHTNKNKQTKIKERDMDLIEMNDYNDTEKFKIRPKKCYLDVSKRR